MVVDSNDRYSLFSPAFAYGELPPPLMHLTTCMLACLWCCFGGRGKRNRIDEAASEVHRILSEDELADCVCLIFANKQDLPTVPKPLLHTPCTSLSGAAPLRSRYARVRLPRR